MEPFELSRLFNPPKAEQQPVSEGQLELLLSPSPEPSPELSPLPLNSDGTIKLDKRADKNERAGWAPNGTHPIAADGHSVTYPRKRGQFKAGLRYDALLEFMLANPTAKLREIAEEFGMNASAISIIINSDLFKERYKEAQEKLFAEVIVPMKAKLTALADVGIEKLMDKVETSNDGKFLAETTMNVLDRIGFSPKGQGIANTAASVTNIQNNFHGVDPSVLARARENFGRVIQPTEDKINDVQSEARETSGASGNGEALPAPAKDSNSEA